MAMIEDRPLDIQSLRLEDGTLVEFCHADAAAGPNHCFGAWKVNACVPFVRVNDGRWRRANGEIQSKHKLMSAVAACKNAAEVDFILHPPKEAAR